MWGSGDLEATVGSSQVYRIWVCEFERNNMSGGLIANFSCIKSLAVCVNASSIVAEVTVRMRESGAVSVPNQRSQHSASFRNLWR